jgi:predicted lipid-binding transport protein (Tim44 family)
MNFSRLIALSAGVLTALVLSIGQAEAARVGGGKNSGKQQPNATQREATPPAGQQAAPAQRPGQPAAAPAAQPQRNSWLGPIAGLAAGIGLAALASHLGFGEELASIMMIVLFAVVALVVIRLIMARRSAGSAQAQPAWAGASAGEAPAASQAPAPVATAPNSLYAPTSSPVAAPLAAGSGPVGAAPSSTGLRVPANFDIAGFVRNAKVQFIRLQASFDSANLADLREFTTPEMFAELRMQIEDRKGSANVTEVVSVEAEFLGVDSSDHEHMASVRFYGVIREAVGAPAQSFDEIWNLSKPVSGSGGWVLAGIQQTESPAA